MKHNGYNYTIGSISVQGFSHIDKNIPCQDSTSYKINKKKQIIAALSDGAGSAELSHLGSKAFVEKVTSKLVKYLDKNQYDPINIKKQLIIEVNNIKSELINNCENSENNSISDFAATLLLIIIDNNKGVIFHVGDGSAAIYVQKSIEDALISLPENGEYANETFFVTQELWEEKLRMTIFDFDYDSILLMSDGVTPMAMQKGCHKLFNNFVNPVVDYLRKNNAKKNKKALLQTLSNENIKPITGDDKSLVWILRNKIEV